MITQPDKEYFANGFTADAMINVQMISQPMRLVTAVVAAGRWARQRGTAEARRVGEQTMEQVRRAMRIDYFA